MVATGQGGVWDSRSNPPCLLFVSAGLIDEEVGGAQQRPPMAHRCIAPFACRISLAFTQLPGAIGAKSPVLLYLTWTRTATRSWAASGASMAEHGRAWQSMAWHE